MSSHNGKASSTSLLQTIRVMRARAARLRRHMGHEVDALEVTDIGVWNQVCDVSDMSQRIVMYQRKGNSH